MNKGGLGGLDTDIPVLEVDNAESYSRNSECTDNWNGIVGRSAYSIQYKGVYTGNNIHKPGLHSAGWSWGICCFAWNYFECRLN